MVSSLSTKLGVKPGHRIVLINPTDKSAKAIKQDCKEMASFIYTLGKGPYDIIIFWPKQSARLHERFKKYQSRITQDGAVWAVIPKKEYAKEMGVSLTWNDVQATALKTDLVDNKVASITEREYGSRFVIRKEKRRKQ